MEQKERDRECEELGYVENGLGKELRLIKTNVIHKVYTPIIYI